MLTLLARTFMQELPSPHDFKILHLQDLIFQLVITRDMNYYLPSIGRDNRSRRKWSSQEYKVSHWRKLPGSLCRVALGAFFFHLGESMLFQTLNPTKVQLVSLELVWKSDFLWPTLLVATTTVCSCLFLLISGQQQDSSSMLSSGGSIATISHYWGIRSLQQASSDFLQVRTF